MSTTRVGRTAHKACSTAVQQALVRPRFCIVMYMSVSFMLPLHIEVRVNCSVLEATHLQSAVHAASRSTQIQFLVYAYCALRLVCLADICSSSVPAYEVVQQLVSGHV